VEERRMRVLKCHSSSLLYCQPFSLEMPLDREKTPPCMDDIALVCSKTYARGLIFLTIYFEGSFYFTVGKNIYSFSMTCS